MNQIIILLFFISLMLFFAGLIKPSLLSKIIKNPSRKKNGWIFGLITIALFILIGISSPSDNPQINSGAEQSDNPIIEQDASISTDTEQNTIEEPTEPLEDKLYSVVYVVDGDTIDVDINGKKERLRLIGIDTPETKDPRKPVQCFGPEASDKAIELLLNQKVNLEFDTTQGERDKYDRLLAYVHREDGLFFNKWIIENGYAREYTYDTIYKYQTEFQTAETTARNNQLGLWSPDTCNGEVDLNKIEDIDEKLPSTDKPESLPELIIPLKADSQVQYSCSASKNCGDMSSCEEAYFYLNTCNKTSLDRDNDGVPCESICN